MKITHHKLNKIKKDFDKTKVSIVLDLEFDKNDNRNNIENAGINIDLEIKEGLGNKILGYTCLEKQTPTTKYFINEDEKVTISLYLWENWEDII